MKTKMKFDKLSKAEKRVAIAKDVIEQINTEKIIATNMVFLVIPIYFQRDMYKQTLKSIIPKNAKCEACALGSLLLSQTNVNGDCKLDTINIDSEIDKETTINPYYEHDLDQFHPFILRYFSENQLRMIEIAFENGRGRYDTSVFYDIKTGIFDIELYNSSPYIIDGLMGEKIQSIYTWIRKYEGEDSPKSRLIRIMENIIENKGTFDPK